MSVKLTGPYKSCKGFRDTGYLCNKLTEKRYLREKVMGYKDQIKQEPSGEIPNFCNWDKWDTGYLGENLWEMGS